MRKIPALNKDNVCTRMNNIDGTTKTIATKIQPLKNITIFSIYIYLRNVSNNICPDSDIEQNKHKSICKNDLIHNRRSNGIKITSLKILTPSIDYISTHTHRNRHTNTRNPKEKHTFPYTQYAIYVSNNISVIVECI